MAGNVGNILYWKRIFNRKKQNDLTKISIAVSLVIDARVAELVDALGLGSSGDNL